MITPQTIEELQDAVRSLDSVGVTGGGTKPALSRGANLSTEKLSGILEYEPSEYTFTALAGTPLAEIRDALAKNGQFLPFDPPFVETGATIGGTVAAGLSGPGRFRFGGVRDFFLGVRMVTGEGQAIFGGGKVVKNAAGFDIPKLNSGALGQWGVLAELTFKVFPAPGEFATILIETANSAESLAVTTRLARSQVELYCLDSVEDSVQVRVGGLPEALEARCERVQQIVGESPSTILRGEDDDTHWNDVREFRWVPSDHALIKLPISPKEADSVEVVIQSTGQSIPHRFSVGSNVVWIAWPNSSNQMEFDRVLGSAKLNRIALTGDWEQPVRVDAAGAAFASRLQSVFDPAGRFAG
jgi:glycolate oxidase FAD binding subunit